MPSAHCHLLEKETGGHGRVDGVRGEPYGREVDALRSLEWEIHQAARKEAEQVQHPSRDSMQDDAQIQKKIGDEEPGKNQLQERA